MIHRFFAALILLNGLMISHSLSAQMDTVSFQGGGTIQGKAVSPENPAEKTNLTIELPDGGSLVLPSDRIRKKTSLSEMRQKYLLSAPLTEDTVDAHLQIAKWCRENGLAEESQKHLKRVIELDPDHGEAHALLNHVKEGGVWMSPKERQELRGFTRYGGQNLTSQEIELEKQREAMKKTLGKLKKEIRQNYQAAQGGNIQAKAAMKAIKNPLALKPLADLMDKETNPAHRLFLTRIIGGLGTIASMNYLGGVALRDADNEVRMAALEQIKKKIIAVPGAVAYFKRALLSVNNDEVNRAAVALGILESEKAIPDLINALITEHQRTIVVGSGQTGASFGSDGRLNSFSPGGNSQKKIITEQKNNEQVLSALRTIVAIHYPANRVDFQYDVPQWKTWYQNEQRTDLFSSRRDRDPVK
ncbi:MAG: HEAT repeat domain-containing protein [Planctomycetia bacterium]|nr:HEAT repeat domain-containing protein [Planctomycetia bacterium]